MATGLLPAASLVEALIQICKEVVAEDKLLCSQTRNSASMIQRIKLLSSLFEEIRDSNNPLHPSSILCLTELFSTIRRVRLLMQACKGRAVLWNLLQAETVAREFHLLVRDLGNALDVLPLSLLGVPPDVREQVELLHRQVKRASVLIDVRDSGRRERLFQLMGNKAGTESKIIEAFFGELGLRNAGDYREEICRLETEIQKQAGTGGLVVVSNLNNLISLVEYSKSLIFRDDNISEVTGELNGQWKQDGALASGGSMASHIPDEFRCPITLDMMRDPVIISSGHSYDRGAIAEWINSGHHSCPKSGRKLIHTALIPNFALRSLISQWCQDNNVLLTAPDAASSSSCGLLEEGFGNGVSSVNEAVDHISATKSAFDAVKLTADFLVGKLATGSTEIRRQAAFELRLLAKTGMVNRRIIAEAGAIPFLVTLLGAHDQRTQENAVTTLLNLSIFDNNKLLIMEAGAIDGIVEVLQKGKSMEARENAAATITSLSMIDKCKITIGTHSAVIQGLVELLREGTSPAKRDAAMALFNLGLYNANKAKVVAAGVISLFVELLVDDKAGITDEALAVLALLSGCPEGLREIRESKNLVTILVDLIRFGSPKGKENSLSLLLGMCRNGEEVAKQLLLNPQSIPSLWTQVSTGSLKARRKADALLRLLNRHFTQSQSSSTTEH
ncbi:hypothetical protein H6P81_006467 [Aristolochia fimbriata]|uniref:RING-type E3 ubiquitin transferase n=1 Tax=Aristolochia fimbriata TaxID=158543 RepID=A0AAV7EXL5_ARIFI|nr:hypothetical protein H6P81_006467 [Aristolochia fimbriata]